MSKIQPRALGVDSDISLVHSSTLYPVLTHTYTLLDKYASKQDCLLFLSSKRPGCLGSNGHVREGNLLLQLLSIALTLSLFLSLGPLVHFPKGKKQA